jgi:hypothetical protein
MSCSWQLVLIEMPWLLSGGVNSEKDVRHQYCLYVFPTYFSATGLRIVYLMFYMVFMAGPLLVAKMKSQLHLLCSVPDCILVMLDYVLLSVELYKDVYSMLIVWRVYDWKHAWD